MAFDFFFASQNVMVHL